MSDDVCVGFADCPCTHCRATRRAATTAHERDRTAPEHDPAYCAACIHARRTA